MDRRTFLAVATATAAAAGCVGQQDAPAEGTPADEETPGVNETPTPSTNETDEDASREDEETPEDDEETPEEDEEPEQDEEADDEEENEDEEDEEEEGEVLEDPPYHLVGNGDGVTNRFVIEGGLTTVEYDREDGSARFVAEFVDPDGERRERHIAAERRSTSGRTATYLPGGEWAIEVTAPGHWEIEVDQPGVEEDDVVDLPAIELGTGRDYRGPFRFEGDVRVEGSYGGSRNVIVEYLRENGRRGGQIFNEIGSFEGETTITRDGIAWVTVDLDAPDRWRLEFEHPDEEGDEAEAGD